ncbi:hypothetical protein EUTSA_v10027418mg [Eutrema salsugineum]|uniref:TF-B3 domain-containing protein n=1 Tax=Eutrema salsugineum TaxID=72664 RepID=V4MFL2_EUTSA|nr:hypothetical protein EUTSA_v10027418mg [Eutrema salsugineum]
MDRVISSSTKKPIFVIDLSEQSSNPMIPDSFISKHFNGKFQSTKLKLTSDASDRAWEVGLDGQRFADGWKTFSDHHCVRYDDVLIFRHDGDMVFHVTPLGRSFSHQIQFLSSTSDDENDDDDSGSEDNIFDDDDDDDNADVKDDDDDGDDDYSTSEEDLYPKKTSSKKRARSEKSYLVAHVTASNLSRNHICLTNKFARANGLNNRQCEIDLRNEEGKSWTMDLRHNKTTGQAFISRGWRSFCKENGLKAESFCRFECVQSGTKPVLQLCPNSSSIPDGNSSKVNEKRNVSETEGDEIESPDRSQTAASMVQNRIFTLALKPYMLRTGQLRLPASLSRGNGINEAGEITVVNKLGVEWKLHLVNIKGRGQFYIRRFKDCFVANGIKKINDSFTLEVVRGGTSPILKICTEERKTPQTVQALRAGEATETPVQKRSRVCVEGGPSRCTRASNKSSGEPENLQGKQPLQSCSISDQVTKVKQSIVETLTDVKRFRSELEIKEQNLEASLLEIDELGMI